MPRHPDVEAIVSQLIGTWVGEGRGQYPTIESFRYRELTEIVERDDHPALRFDQRAWKVTPEGEVVSHWETGLLRISSDGSAVFHDAQGGRSETMAGTWERDTDGWSLALTSTGYAGDDRVIGSTRMYWLRPGELEYEMQMETTATRRMSLHLHATLRRVGAG
jgi:hypothetical protein